MPAKMSEYQRFILSVTCPKCNRGNGHHCRDQQGKCVPPHRERSQAALKTSCATLTYWIPNRRPLC
jgi:hypothetical protein